MEKISIELRIEYTLSIIHYWASDLMANVGTQQWDVMLQFLPNKLKSDEKQVQILLIMSAAENALKHSTCSEVYRRKAYLDALHGLINDADFYNMIKVMYDDKMASDLKLLQNQITEYIYNIK